MVLRVTAAMIWLTLFSTVVTALHRHRSFQAVDGRAIAKLSSQSGSVQTRSEEMVAWRDAGQGQGLFEGDRVATGRQSTARINFGNGRELAMGEDSQIVISAIEQGKDFNF